jgi:hypothetical protein
MKALAALLVAATALAAPTPGAASGSGPGLEVKAELVLPPRDGGEPAARVGEPIRLIVSARHAPGDIAILSEELGLPEAIGERKAARVHRRSTETPATGEAAELDRYELEVIPFEAGELQIPKIALALGSTTAYTAALPLTVETGLKSDEALVASSTQAAAIAELDKLAAPDPPPRAISVPDYTLAAVLGGVVALAALALIARSVLSRKRIARASEPPPPPPRPAHELALERLAALERAGHVERGAFKEYYVELSEILRSYAGGRYGFESVELTVPELMDSLRARHTPGLDLALLDRILREADLVKFAKYQPPELEAKSAMNHAQSIVECTRPASTPPPTDLRSAP